ncbi:hypothetical protein B0J12DRAFT_742987 [Macrophomina phaseolina]|uniref:Uncharacterized protein n=1 Tax=Macrophomina phaseolina TaxID=35725 RepID=A0ABQ8G2E8_9PEZI|nr:hypothetical protein B0J12DRAFT_742987 [Macrophomina phaseolina]
MCERRASSDATPAGGNGIFSCSAIMPGSQQRKCSIRAAVSPLWPAQRRSAVHAESSRAANYAVGIVSQDHPWIVWPASVANWTHTDVQDEGAYLLLTVEHASPAAATATDLRAVAAALDTALCVYY